MLTEWASHWLRARRHVLHRVPWSRIGRADWGSGERGAGRYSLGHIGALREVVVVVLLDGVQDLAIQDQRRPAGFVVAESSELTGKEDLKGSQTGAAVSVHQIQCSMVEDHSVLQ